MKNIYLFLVVAISMSLGSCFNDLNTVPLDEELITSGIVYDDPATYKAVLAKLYAGLAVSGQEGPAGRADISGIDEGFGQYLRGFWYHQEFTTDEAVVGWNDLTIGDYHNQSWTSSDGFTYAFYSRIMYQITLCNEFIRQTEPNVLEDRNVDAAIRTEVETYRHEARFLRALSYWHALDIFRNVPFVTEEDVVGSFFPQQTNAQDLFAYIESELLDIEDKITPSQSNEYGRASSGAVQTLLAKLYINAQTYVNVDRNEDALIYAKKVIDAGYSLDPSYPEIFLADNHKSPEIIFPVTFDGNRTRTYGGMTFIIRAGIGGDMPAAESGVISGWSGVRTTKQLVEKFPVGGGTYVEASAGSTANHPKIYVPNSTQGFDATDADATITAPNGDKIYEGHLYFPEANGEFFISKFPSMNPQKFGDSDNDGVLESGGNNIVLGDAGVYYIQVNLNDNSYAIEKREWAIIGDATPNGWDTETPMTYDPERNAFVVDVLMGPGSFKFRANNDWAANLGDGDGDAILDYDGDNIGVDIAENFKILLYIDKPDYTYQIDLNSFDRRAMFYSEGHNIEIDDILEFTDGYAVQKFKNITSTGEQGINDEYPDTDFPLFRLADMYLTASEAILRGANGTKDEALTYFNHVRTRAYTTEAANINEVELTLDAILDERAREFYWECHRRTDLIRFGQFSDGDYVWAWKGGVKEGTQVESYRDVFPIPSADMTANPNLEQNDGY